MKNNGERCFYGHKAIFDRKKDGGSVDDLMTKHLLPSYLRPITLVETPSTRRYSWAHV